MTTVELLREQLKAAHSTQEATIEGTTEEALNSEGVGKALSAGVAYVHSVISEDMIVAKSLQNKTPLSQTRENIGISEPMPWMDNWDKYPEWTKNVKVDLPKFREFAKKVYQETDNYLASLTPEDIAKEVEVPGIGMQTLGLRISTFVILHIASLTGEISAAKGAKGIKGYPF
jgi:hypothetical protein